MYELSGWRRRFLHSKRNHRDQPTPRSPGPTHSVLVARVGVPWLAAMTATYGLVACSQANSPATSDLPPGNGTQDSATSDTSVEVSSDSTVNDGPTDLGLGDDIAVDSGGDGSWALVDASDAGGDAEAEAPDPNIGQGPYGPWTFSTPEDLLGWELYGPTDNTNECRMELDPANGGSLKITFGPPDCMLRWTVHGADVHDRRMKIRMRSAVGATTSVAAKMFSLAGAFWVDDGTRTVPTDWRTRTFLFDNPGASVRYDPMKISHFGITFEGTGGTVWIDELELVQEPPNAPLPAYEFNGSSTEEELDFKSAGVISSSAKLHEDGYLMIRGNVTMESSLDYGMVSPIDLSRTQTVRVRLRPLNDYGLQVFTKTGSQWKWSATPITKGLPVNEWTEIVWDVRAVQGLSFVREWGIHVFDAEGDVGLDVDWIRFEETPIAATDAGADGDAPSIAQPSADAETGVLDSAEP